MAKTSAKEWKEKIYRKLHLHDVPPGIRRVIIGVIGGTVLLAGIAMIVLPGPAFIIIPFGLAILATEFVWAQRWLHKARKAFAYAREKVGQARKK